MRNQMGIVGKVVCIYGLLTKNLHEFCRYKYTRGIMFYESINTVNKIYLTESGIKKLKFIFEAILLRKIRYFLVTFKFLLSVFDFYRYEL